MSQCKVYLENYNGVYYAGSDIRGRVECYFDDEITLRGIKIRIKCEESNSWSGTESYTDPTDNKSKTRTITLSGENTVLYFEQMLYGSDGGSSTLGRGRHVYPFSYVLPEAIPSTFNGPHGRINYKIKAIVDRPMRTDFVDDFIFIVKSPIDFNKKSSDLQNVTTYSDEKSVCCWCCRGGNITMNVELPKTAFVPGETIPFKVDITNLSNTNVENLKVKLVKTVTYKVTSPHHETKQDVDNIIAFNEHGVGAHGEYTYNLTLNIPSYLDVPNFTKCNLFNVTYELKVSAELPSCVLDLDISCWDIQFGHIQVGSEHAYKDAPPIANTNQTPNVPQYYPQPANYPTAPTSGFPVSPVGGYPNPTPGFPAPPQPSYNTPGMSPVQPIGGFITPGTYPMPVPSPYPPPNPYATPTGYPSTPSTTPSAPIDNPKAMEAAKTSTPINQNTPSELPPSYSEIHHSVGGPPYPPQ